MTAKRTGRWALRLYVSGVSAQSTAAIENVRRICDEDLAGQADVEIVDVRADPARAAEDGVVTAPTLVRRQPEPVRLVVGDLADLQRVRSGLDLATSTGREVTR